MKKRRSTKNDSVKKKNNSAFKRMARSKSAMQLHLLPPDVLRSILSQISFKEAARMSMLSRECRRLGLCHPDMVFTRATFFGSDADAAAAAGNTTHPARTTADFVTKVDSILHPLWSSSTSTSATLDKFVVKFGLRMNHTYHVDRWIRFATVSGAKHIALDFTEWGYGSEDGKYVVPLRLFCGQKGSSVKSPDLGYVSLNLPGPSFNSGGFAFASLKKVRLHEVSISNGGDDLQRLLLGCALLEWLSIEACSGLSSLSIHHRQLCRLQYLHVRCCELETIELQAPNLITFEFDDHLTQIVLSESLKMSEATVVLMGLPKGDALDYTLTGLPAALPHVQKLSLRFRLITQVLGFTKTPARFVNLRHLNLNIDVTGYPRDSSWILRLVYFLELAPLWEELELHMDCFAYSGSRGAAALPGHPHRHLKSVYMTGFWDRQGMADLALYILRNATVLGRMVIDPMIVKTPGSLSVLKKRIHRIVSKERTLAVRKTNASRLCLPVSCLWRTDGPFVLSLFCVYVWPKGTL